jgi:hypothetical protein
MGLGEVGGNGSVQVAVWTRKPTENAEQDAAAAWKEHRDDLSAKALRHSPTEGLAYLAQDEKRQSGDLGNFEVTITFRTSAELGRAFEAFGAAVKAGQLQVTFMVPVLPKTPGQIHITWDDEVGVIGRGGTEGGGKPKY